MPLFEIGTVVGVCDVFEKGRRLWTLGVIKNVTPAGFMDVNIHGSRHIRFNPKGKEHGGKRWLSDLDDLIRRAVKTGLPLVSACYDDSGTYYPLDPAAGYKYPRRILGDPHPGQALEGNSELTTRTAETTR